MIYFTLNGVKIKSGRVGTMQNRSKIGCPSRISRQSREAAVGADQAAGAEGVLCCRRATWHNQRATRVQRSRVEERVVRSSVWMSGGLDSGCRFWLRWAEGFLLRWAGLNLIGPQFDSVGQGLNCWAERLWIAGRRSGRTSSSLPDYQQIFLATHSLSLSLVTSFQRPFSSFFQHFWVSSSP